MFKRAVSLGLAAMITTTAWFTPVQAAGFAYLQPYVSDYKIGFTDGTKRMTQPLYDTFSKENQVLIVTKNGKQGVLNAKTGKEIIPAVWDRIEIPERNNVAILQAGNKVQYFIFSHKAMSKQTFREGTTFYLSSQHNSVIRLSGDTTMLLDANGTVLIPPFKGQLNFVDWKNPPNSKEESTRYLIATTAKEVTLYDPNTLKPLFRVPNVTVRLDNLYQVNYLEVVRNGKTGLLNRDGSFALEPNYSSVMVMPNGYVRLQGPQGVGLFKDGKVLLEPIYTETGDLGSSEQSYYSVKGDTVTYYSRSAGALFSLKKGAEYLYDGYVMGQDPDTGLYGVKSLKGEIIAPFEYKAMEGPPAAWTLVRNDGKKGLIVQRGNEVKAPEIWFDSYVTMGSYSMLAIKDGKKHGLYSQDKGMLIPLQENIVLRYDSTTGAVLATFADGKTREYRWYDEPVGGSKPEEHPDITQPQISSLTDELSRSYVRDQGTTIIFTKTGKPVSQQVYETVYLEDKLVVALKGDTADLYTTTGELITTECKIAASSHREGPPVTLMPINGSIYALGVKSGTIGNALVKINGNQLEVLTQYTIGSLSVQSLKGKTLLGMTRRNGTIQLATISNNQIGQKLDNVQEYLAVEPYGKVFVKENGGWDIYSDQLERITSHKYKSLKIVSNSTTEANLLLFQDSKTGLYGILKWDMSELTKPKYEFIRSATDVFPQLYGEKNLPNSFVFTAGKQFGYLNASGQEIFQTPLYSKQPKVTHRPLKAGAFPEFDQLMENNAAQIVDFGKPYRMSDQFFYQNVALYLNLPQESGKQEVQAELIKRGILSAERKGQEFTYEDFFALAYYMKTGTVSKLVNKEELWKWATSNGYYYEHSPRESFSLHADFNLVLINKLLLSKQAGIKFKPAQLSLETLTEEQRQMLLPLIQVNGLNYDQLPYPLAKEYVDSQLKQIIGEYNKQSTQILQTYLQARGMSR